MTESQKKLVGVYILRSQRNNRYYVGSTIDLYRRLEQHKNGQVKATKYLLPIKLVFFQKYNDIQQARRAEYKIKKLKRKDYIERMIQEGCIKMR